MKPTVKYELPPNMPEDVKAKILQTMGDEGLGESKPSTKKKKNNDDDHDDAEDEEDSDSELPEDWAERFGIKEMTRADDDERSSTDTERSSDDWSTISEELSEETRNGRPDADKRERPVELGPLETVADVERLFQDVTGDGGVLKRIFREGDGPYAGPGFSMAIKYVILTEEGALVDVSQNDMWDNKEFNFTVGSGDVMRGLDVVACHMKRREKARFRIRSDYCFGEQGCLPKIAAGTKWLILDVEMMGMQRPHREKLYLRDNEVIPYVTKRKEQGNEFFKAGQYRKAVHEYKSCTKVIALIQDDSYKRECAPLALALLGNLAAAHLGMKNWRRVIKYSTEVLSYDPKNEKALFRRSQALRHYPERLEDALKDLAEAIRLAPSNKQLRREYETLQEEVRIKRKADKMAYGTIFRRDAQIYQAKRPRVFFELSQGKSLLGRMEIELYNDKVPKAAENFRQLCIGWPESSKRLHYQGTLIHRVIEDYIVQGGDVTGKAGKGGESIYGPKFDDEDLNEKMDRRGLVVMANSGPNTNSSQFFITLAPCTDLQGKYVVVGRVVAGKNTLQKLANADVDARDCPVTPIKIFKSGECKEKDRMADEDD